MNLKHFIKKTRNLFYIYDKINQLGPNITNFLRIEYLTQKALYSTEPGITNNKYCDYDIIASLTTYGDRLQEVYLTIESIMQQSIKPNKIILWLEDELKKVELPVLLKKQIQRGLEVHYYKNIRSYKKLIPTLKYYPNDAVITLDDDLLYNTNMLEHLITNHIKDPQTIYYNRGHLMTFKRNGELEKYNKWKWFQTSIHNPNLNFPTTGGGVLYPPHCFNAEVLNEEIFMKLCPTADDIWFKAMSLYNNRICKKAYTTSPIGEDYIENTAVQNITLSKVNVDNGKNDLQIKQVFDYYHLYEKLK